MKVFVASLPSRKGNIVPPQDIYGCMDPLATNYNPFATIDDGSCTYNPVTLEPPTDIFLEELTTDVEGTFDFVLPFILY